MKGWGVREGSEVVCINKEENVVMRRDGKLDMLEYFPQTVVGNGRAKGWEKERRVAGEERDGCVKVVGVRH